MQSKRYKRIHLLLTPEQIRKLDEIARVTGGSRSIEVRRRIDEGPSEKDVRIRVAELEADAAKHRAMAAQANAYGREQTRRAQTVRANMRQIMKSEENATKIALARIARGQGAAPAGGSSGGSAPPAMAPPPSPPQVPQVPQAERAAEEPG